MLCICLDKIQEMSELTDGKVILLKLLLQQIINIFLSLNKVETKID